MSMRMFRKTPPLMAADTGGKFGDKPDPDRKKAAPRHCTILVVDDEDMMRNMTGSIIGRMGHSVKTAGNGADALEIFRAGGIDLVITDIVMPVMDGIALLSEVKKIDPNAKVICQSGNHDTERVDALKAAGASCILNKPCPLADFKSAVTAALDS